MRRFLGRSRISILLPRLNRTGNALGLFIQIVVIEINHYGLF